MPSNNYVNLTLGASGSTYTAPAAGYFTAHGTGSSSYTSIFFILYGSGICSGYTTGSNGDASPMVHIFCRKGDTVEMRYTDINTWAWFRFVYAEGTVPVA